MKANNLPVFSLFRWKSRSLAFQLTTDSVTFAYDYKFKKFLIIIRNPAKYAKNPTLRPDFQLYI